MEGLDNGIGVDLVKSQDNTPNVKRLRHPNTNRPYRIEVYI